MAALRADRSALLTLAADLQDDEWGAPSDCAGWRVQDVVAHLANTCRAVADPQSLPAGVDGDVEATADAQAAAHRHWAPEEVLEDYEQISAAALGLLESFQKPPHTDTIVPIEDLGRYPLHLVANALAFDHFCHLRNDILAPNGPIDRPAPPADEARVGATLEWLAAGLPQMSVALADVVDDPVTLDLTGAGATRWVIARDPSGSITVTPGDRVAVTVTSPATEFIIWATRRRPWRERDVRIEGDADYAASVLDAIHLF